MVARRSSYPIPPPGSAAAPDFHHPYLRAGQAGQRKRELGLMDLFKVKLLRCFAVDDNLPPPDMAAPVYQAERSGSTGLSAGTRSSWGGVAQGGTSSVKVVLPKYNQPPPPPPPPPPGAKKKITPGVFAAGTNFEQRERAELGAGVHRFGKVSSVAAMFEQN